MGQSEIYDALEGNEWMNMCDILKVVDFLSTSSITESLRRLYKKGILEKKKDPSKSHGYLYRLKNETK